VRPAESLNLVEVFSSVQGEGVHVGASTLFIRLGECDLRCRWCDTPHSWRPSARCRVETERGTASFREVENPIPTPELEATAEALDFRKHRFVSFTGGEPLLQAQGLRDLAQRLHGQGPRLHLETHGLHTDALAQVIDWIDVVSMDWKLASDVRRAEEPRGVPVADFHDQHRSFLERALQDAEVMVKVVVTPASGRDELRAMADAVASVDRDVPLIVQPVTPFGACRDTLPARDLIALVATLERTLSDVRLIPQTHKVIGAP